MLDLDSGNKPNGSGKRLPTYIHGIEPLGIT
jgi:hypothetical protein